VASFYLDADVHLLIGVRLSEVGHDVVATTQIGRAHAGDEEQLAYSAQTGRILVTHNGDDFLLLQKAWRYWADLWGVQPKPMHAGILSVPQPPKVTVDRLAHEIALFVRSHAVLANRFHEWTPARGWVQHG